jgi:hypothetical protein
MHQSGKLAVSQEDRKPLPLVGFLPLLLAACQPVITRYGQQNLSLSENQATGGGSDIFVNYKFSSCTVAGSEDVITDFLDGTDLIGLEKAHSGSTAVTFSDLTLTSVTRQDGGTDTRITAVSKYLWLVENTAPADFSVADFIAVGLASDGFA